MSDKPKTSIRFNNVPIKGNMMIQMEKPQSLLLGPPSKINNNSALYIKHLKDLLRKRDE